MKSLIMYNENTFHAFDRLYAIWRNLVIELLY